MEGNNENNQLEVWYKKTGLVPSGIACDHYHKYKQDIDLMKELGYNAYRFSIEWSRVEPTKGYFDEKEIEHYREVVTYLKEKDILPIPTLLHWTNPLWFMDEGGWIKEENVDYFAKFVEKIAKEFEFKYWLTIAEPQTYAFNACQIRGGTGPVGTSSKGILPPEGRGVADFFKICSNFLKAHAMAYEAIHDHSKGKVSINIAINTVDPASNSPLDLWTAKCLDYLVNEIWLDSLKEGKPKPPLSGEEFGNTLDFCAVNYFFREMVQFDKNSLTLPGNFLLKLKNYCERSQLGWEVYPEGIYRALKRVHEKFDMPVLISSNGIGTDDDSQRRRFIVNHLKQIRKAMDGGVDVRGYMHWSFMDTFEWHLGFEPRFGLVHVDYDTLERIPKKSAYMYGEIAKMNGINSEIEEKYLPIRDTGLI